LLNNYECAQAKKIDLVAIHIVEQEVDIIILAGKNNLTIEV